MFSDALEALDPPRSIGYRKGMRSFCLGYKVAFQCCPKDENDCPSSSSSDDDDSVRSTSSESSASTSDADSEKSDMFNVSLATNKDWTTPLDRFEEKVRALSRHMRSWPLLPPHPQDYTQSWTGVDAGIRFPKWHCAFRGCGYFPISEVALVKHMMGSTHEDVFDQVVGEYDPKRATRRNWRMSFYVAAIRHIERSRMPAHRSTTANGIAV